MTIFPTVKKILREPLFYLLPLLAITSLAVFNTGGTDVKILDVKLTRNHITKDIKFPYLANDNIPRDEIFSVSFNLSAKNKPVVLNAIPDDCIREISINGNPFPLEGIKGLCDYHNGAFIDFSEYVREGLNYFVFRMDNRGGGAFGLNVTKIAKTSLKHLPLMHYVFALLLLVSFFSMLWKFKRNEVIFKSVLLFAASFLFYLIADNASKVPGVIPADSIVFLTAIFFAASFVFLPDKRVNYTAFVFILAMLATFMLVRGGLLHFKSSDYNAFINSWLEQMRNVSITEAIRAKIGDYNMPYLYVLALISRSDINNFFLVKFVSIAFDAVLAYYAMKIVSVKFESINVQITAFAATLGIPTVMLNSAFWGQCDVIYAALAIATFYYGFTGKSIRSLVFFGLAFSVKLQTVFIAPMLIVFLFTKKIKVYHLWVPILTFFATLVPALIAGKPFMETISIYYNQINSYPQMECGAPNIYVLLGNVNFENFNFIAILMTGGVVASLLYFLYVNREKITSPADYVGIAFVFVLAIPMLLPRMHERYFFLADVLSVVLIFFNRKKWYFAPIIILGSFMTYSRFLLGKDYTVLKEYASITMIFVTLIAVKDLVERFTATGIEVNCHEKNSE